MLLLAFVGLLVVFVPGGSLVDLPDYFPRCYRDKPNLSNCIVKAAYTLKPYLQKGVQEISIPAYGPLIVSTFGVAQESSIVNYTATAWNCTVAGLDNYDFEEIQFDPATLTFRGKLNYDSLLVSTPYEFDGKLLNIPVSGKGVVRADFGPTTGTFEINGRIVKRKGVEYYTPVEMKLRMTIEDAQYYFDGLFEDEAMARMTNEMINKNSKAITDAVTPTIEKLAEAGWMRVMKSFTKAVPYHKLFPLST